MKSQWRKQEAERMVRSYARKGVNRDLALRVYTTRLLGRDPRLVLHGGGNTSVKTTMKDVLGKPVDVLCIKGSGWDMGDIEPRGLPALRLSELHKLRNLDVLSDEEMVNYQRACLLDSTSPNPSVETLLHAFLPQKYVDHTHSTAVLAITDQPDGAALCREVFGNRVALVPYVMPGFALAKKAAEVFESSGNVDGLVLLKHGIFTFGESACEAYERMTSLVSLAELRLRRKRRKVFKSSRIPSRVARIVDVAPILRGQLAEPANGDDADWRRTILEFRTSKPIRNYVDGQDLSRYSQVGVVTPDHTIRTKNWPLILPAPAADDLASYSREVKKRIDRYVRRYHGYFARHNGKREEAKVELDPYPRVILIQGLGLFGAGKSVKEARVAADIAENTVEVITDAEAIGRYRPVNEADMFDIEYWTLEQAKLGKGAELPFSRQVVVVTGGGSGIGAATARAFAAGAAAVAVLDRDGTSAQRTAEAIGQGAIGIVCDVTDGSSVRRAFDRICKTFGGIDIVVSNAGAAWQGSIGTVSDQLLRESFELNFFAHQTVAQNAVRVMSTQGTGGALLFNASKQAVNPGKDFGPYGLPKATTLFLARQYALEYGELGITANAVNADRVHTGLFKGGLLEERAAARGLSVDQYLRGSNLLKREVRAEDVAKAFVDLALSRKTTAAVMTVDGGNIEAALR
tara:strand:- start:92 stop:2155 length:2064 start_codon:yes stop_codon:yes gene_type:complete